MRKAGLGLVCVLLAFGGCSSDDETDDKSNTGGKAGTGGADAATGGTGGSVGGSGGSAGVATGGSAGVATGGSAGSTGGSAGSTGGTAGSTGGSAGSGPDAGPTYSGELTLLEVSVLNPGTSGTSFGQGVDARFVFQDTASFPPVMEEQPGSPLGCKAWSIPAAQAQLARTGIDEGSIQVTGPAAAYPACTFFPNAGYLCPHTGTASTGGTIAAGPAAGTATLTDADVTFNSGNTTNRYINVQGAANAANNGTFPIVALAGANTIVYGNPAMVAETLPATASHVNLAGVGATPQVPDPGFLLDSDLVSFALTPGGGNHFAAFTVDSPATGGVGDDFTLSTVESNKLNAIPTDGSSFTVSCDSTSCPSGSGIGSILDLIATDGPTAGLSPFAMPPPTTTLLRVRCTLLGQLAVTIPAAFSALIQGANVTRIQATFIRPNLMTGGPANVTAVSGHAIRGYTSP